MPHPRTDDPVARQTIRGAEPPARRGRILVLCPLEIEAAAARRAVRRVHDIRADRPRRDRSAPVVEVRRTGPGPDAARRAVRQLIGERPGQPSSGGPIVVIAGLSGGLTGAVPEGAGTIVRAVAGDPAGDAPVPSALGALLADRLGAPAALAVTVAAPVCSADAKRRLADRTGADLVDCETLPVATEADRAGRAWLAVRAVSDGPDRALPEAVARWVDESGRSRPARVLADAARRPALLADAARLARSSRRARRSLETLLAQVLEDLLEREAAEGPTIRP